MIVDSVPFKPVRITICALLLWSGGWQHALAADLLGSATKASQEAPKISEMPTADTDDETAKVLRSVMQQTGWFPELKLEVKDGFVTIEGRASKRDHVEWLVKASERLPHVIAVVDKS